MNIYLNENNLTQERFDMFKEDVLDVVTKTEGGESKMFLNKEDEPIGTTVLMGGYWDIDDEGQVTPHFWYNKKELDEHNIKY